MGMNKRKMKRMKNINNNKKLLRKLNKSKMNIIILNNKINREIKKKKKIKEEIKKKIEKQKKKILFI